MSYRSGSHTVFHHRYPIVWITKYRDTMLEGAGADTNDDPAGGQGTRRPDRLRRVVAGACPYLEVLSLDNSRGLIGGNPSRQLFRVCNS